MMLMLLVLVLIIEEIETYLIQGYILKFLHLFNISVFISTLTFCGLKLFTKSAIVTWLSLLLGSKDNQPYGGNMFVSSSNT